MGGARRRDDARRMRPRDRFRGLHGWPGRWRDVGRRPAGRRQRGRGVRPIPLRRRCLLRQRCKELRLLRTRLPRRGVQWQRVRARGTRGGGERQHELARGWQRPLHRREDRACAAPGLEARCDLATVAQRTDVYEIGFNAKSIFYSGGGNLRRIDRESGTDTQLSSQVNVLSVAAADDYIYFCDYANGQGSNGALYRRRESDGTIMTIVSGTTSCETIAITGTDVVYGENGNAGAQGAVWRVPQSGGAPVMLSSNGARRLVVDSGWIYFITFDATQVRRVMVDGTNETVVGASPAGSIQQGNVAVDATYVYWTVDQESEPGRRRLPLAEDRRDDRDDRSEPQQPDRPRRGRPRDLLVRGWQQLRLQGRKIASRPSRRGASASTPPSRRASSTSFAWSALCDDHLPVRSPLTGGCSKTTRTSARRFRLRIPSRRSRTRASPGSPPTRGRSPMPRLDSRRRWLARWVFAVAAVVLCAALTTKLLL